jgi:hypothetical protein
LRYIVIAGFAFALELLAEVGGLACHSVHYSKPGKVRFDRLDVRPLQRTRLVKIARAECFPNVRIANDVLQRRAEP